MSDERLAHPFVVMGVGTSGSGKTTRLKPFAEEVGAEYLSSDDIRRELSGDESAQNIHKEVWDTLYSRAQEHLGEKRSIIVDATHAKDGERTKAIDLYRGFGAASVIALLFDPELEAAIKNNEQRTSTGGRSVPDHAIRRMHEQIRQHPPSEEEGFDAIVRAKS